MTLQRFYLSYPPNIQVHIMNNVYIIIGLSFKPSRVLLNDKINDDCAWTVDYY